MAFQKLSNIRIVGISAGVPRNIVENEKMSFEGYDAKDFVNTTGVKQRRIDHNLTTSDLCYSAAESLIKELGWNKSEIDALIFVSQYPDYILPATSCILQDRLGLGKECYSEDISLGCTGWVYGLSTVCSLMQTGEIKKALLMAGDAKRSSSIWDDPLFGFAGTVTAFEYDENARPIYAHFGTDGSGYEAIIIPDGAARNQVSINSFKEEIIDGKRLNALTPRMKGLDVFSFGISVPPKSIKKLCSHYNLDYKAFDYYIFHQANLKMNDVIVKKLGLNMDQVPLSMPLFGNTSSASIPLTMVACLKDKLNKEYTKILACGFGVGLSWGTIAFEIENNILLQLIEI